MLPVVHVDIEQSVIVPCPKLTFARTYAANACPGCENFEGVAQMATEGAWHQRFVIRCAHVIERRCEVIQ